MYVWHKPTFPVKCKGYALNVSSALFSDKDIVARRLLTTYLKTDRPELRKRFRPTHRPVVKANELHFFLPPAQPSPLLFGLSAYDTARRL
ncbi:hypothetical protein RRG08_029816 [Elysia crispata]|uniref:Uncharacterized protein n=1 Tax=Elysia crispata TaxID=231223 RepID=A0AAE1D183_9GAST|nr:hypothetical protein RRG08_029816 [Elysia crispata]